MNTTQRVPLLYRIIFTYVDPVVAFVTGYLILFHRDTILGTLSPLFLPRHEVYDPLLWQLAGGYWITSIMQGVMLRYSNDLGVWKISNLAIMVMDLLIVGSMWEMRGPPHNLALSMSSKDWGNAIGAGSFAILRLAFLLDIGFKKESNKKKA